eukprot:1143602-Pyramimonas_sp.AAC.1
MAAARGRRAPGSARWTSRRPLGRCRSPKRCQVAPCGTRGLAWTATAGRYLAATNTPTGGRKVPRGRSR